MTVAFPTGFYSTLDPVLRMEQKGINPWGLALLGTGLAYLFATPGALPAAILACPLPATKHRQCSGGLPSLAN